jgi:carbonic anhydrase
MTDRIKSRCFVVVVSVSILVPMRATGQSAVSHSATTSEASIGPAEGLSRLKAGNDRYVGQEATHPDQTSERLASLASGQHPFAIILSCSDSRVPPEIVFDQGLGDLFVVREAGNTVNDAVLGSIEYAVEHLGTQLIVVLGHETCGAVQAAMSGKAEGGHIPALTKPISPVIAEAKKMPGDPVHNAVLLNARRSAKELSQSAPFLKERVAAGTLEVVVAVYDVATGRVTFQP